MQVASEKSTARKRVIMATTKQLVGITSQHNEIVKRVGNGSLDPTVVKQALQDIIEGKLPQVQNWSLPIWWRTAEQQLERARQLWPNAVLPVPPKAFTPWFCSSQSRVVITLRPFSANASSPYFSARYSRINITKCGARMPVKACG